LLQKALFPTRISLRTKQLQQMMRFLNTCRAKATN